MDSFPETTRDFKLFSRRTGDLPTQQDGDTMDYRYLLHRDGSVLTAVTLAQLQSPEKLYKDLGCKLVVGMPFKDIATSDSLFLSEVPPVEDAEARRALKRLQDVNVGVLAPLEALKAAPLPNSVAVVSLSDFAAAGGKVRKCWVLWCCSMGGGTPQDGTLLRMLYNVIDELQLSWLVGFSRIRGWTTTKSTHCTSDSLQLMGWLVLPVALSSDCHITRSACLIYVETMHS